MINNRQGGRRRGRGGGGRPPSSSPGAGNRQDNRQRGNAAQLLEKYKGMARDAQMQGDRVLTENYLQFADHYFRVLNESRARYEEQRPQRDDYSDEEEDREEQSGGFEASERQGRDEPEPREADTHREERQPRDRGDQRNGEFRQQRRPRGRADSDVEAASGDEDERIALDVLPPAIAATGSDGEEPVPAPRRRGRRPRDSGEEIAPAA